MTDVKVETSPAANGDVKDVKEQRQNGRPRQRQRSHGNQKFDEAALEKEFKGFVEKLKKQYGANSLASQISSHPEVRNEAVLCLEYIFE